MEEEDDDVTDGGESDEREEAAAAAIAAGDMSSAAMFAAYELLVPLNLCGAMDTWNDDGDDLIGFAILRFFPPPCTLALAPLTPTLSTPGLA